MLIKDMDSCGLEGSTHSIFNKQFTGSHFTHSSSRYIIWKKLWPFRDSDPHIYEGKSTFPYRLNQAGINSSYSLPQHPCQENPMDRGAWQATVHRTAKSWTCLGLSTQTMHLNRLCFLDWVDIILGLEKFYNPSVCWSEPYYGMGPANKILEITETLFIKYIYRWHTYTTENKNTFGKFPKWWCCWGWGDWVHMWFCC